MRMQNYKVGVGKKTPVWWDGYPENAAVGKTSQEAIGVGYSYSMPNWVRCLELPPKHRVVIDGSDGRPCPRNMLIEALAEQAKTTGPIKITIGARCFNFNITYIDKVKVIFK